MLRSRKVAAVISLLVASILVITVVIKPVQRSPSHLVRVLKETENGTTEVDDNLKTGRLPASNLEHWIPDWYNQTDIGLLLYNRVRNVKARCQTYVGSRNEWKIPPRIELRSAKSLQYCSTAKAGSTFWGSLLERSRDKAWRSSPERNVHVRLTTVRNPWHRLVSTYIQKIEAKKNTWPTLVRSLCLQNWKNKPNFHKFVKDCVLALWKKRKYNIHWLPATERCDICNSHYDFIIAVENMAVEANFALSEAGLENPSKLFNKTRERTIRKNEKKKLSEDYRDYYVGMDPEDIKALRQLYNFEIYVLQYPLSPFVDFVKS